MTPRVRKGDRLVEITDPRGGWSVVAAYDGEPSDGPLLRGTAAIALCDETVHRSVLVDVSPQLVYGGGRGVWMRVGDRPS
jgi:hypothetical protein